MADKIQLILETMIPELDAYVQNGLFTKSQVKNIIKKRRNHEYSMVKKIVTKEEYLKAIRYEKVMNKRKDKTKKEKKIKKSSYNDFHCK